MGGRPLALAAVIFELWSAPVRAQELPPPPAPPPDANANVEARSAEAPPTPPTAPAPPPPAPAPPKASSAAAPVAPAPEPGRHAAVVKFVAEDHAAMLQSTWRPDGAPSDWYNVCAAPCTRRVPPEAVLRASGDDFEPSEPFRVPQGKARVVATSRLETGSRRTGAIMIVSGYISFFVVGPVVMLVGLGRSLGNESDGEAVAVTGALITLGGAIVGTAGVVVLIVQSSNKQSVVEVARRGTPRLELGRGVALEPRGLTF